MVLIGGWSEISAEAETSKFNNQAAKLDLARQFHTNEWQTSQIATALKAIDPQALARAGLKQEGGS